MNSAFCPTAWLFPLEIFLIATSRSSMRRDSTTPRGSDFPSNQEKAINFATFSPCLYTLQSSHVLAADLTTQHLLDEIVLASVAEAQEQRPSSVSKWWLVQLPYDNLWPTWPLEDIFFWRDVVEP